jgi:hypothetical protein
MKAAWQGHVLVVRALLKDRPGGIDDVDASGADPNVSNR